jgi:NAD(P)H dehydrogenase (quinone)
MKRGLLSAYRSNHRHRHHPKEFPMLLITGANGKLGRLIVDEVLRRAPDVPLAVSVRDAAAAADLAERGVEVRQADYHDVASTKAAFAGVDRLLLMPTPTPDPEARVAEMIPVAQAAAEAGARHVVYPGTAQVDGLDFALLDAHKRVFAAIEATGVATTHLRHGIYAEVIAGEVAGAVAAGELAAPVGDAKVAPVLRSDLAAGIATVLLEGGHEGQTYDFTGPDAVSWEDLAGLASERAGTTIAFRSIDDDEAEARMKAAGLPEAFIPAMLGFYRAYRAGWSSTPSGDLERLAGNATTPSLQAIAAVLDGTAQ